jgi:arylsulfatase A-like enzyme
MPDRAQPHVILIIMDSVAARRCSTYGHARETTPGLSRLAGEGVLYRHCYTPAPWTIPAHASLFSGLYPGEHGCDEKSAHLPPGAVSLPQALKEAGYGTAAISSNGLVSFQSGFDVFYEMDTLFTSPRYQRDRAAVKELIKASGSEWGRLLLTLKYVWQHRSFTFPLANMLDRFHRKHFVNIFQNSAPATARSLAITGKLLQSARQPLFVFMNLMETHWRYNPPKGRERFIRLTADARRALMDLNPIDFYLTGIGPGQMEQLALLYEEELAYLDELIWGFYQYLKASGLAENTLFIVTADHGESLGEHGLWGHYFGLYNELMHIPLVVRYPEAMHLQGEVAGPVQLHDLYATILEVAGSGQAAPASSRSLVSPARDFALADHPNPGVGLMALTARVPDFPATPLMQPCRSIVGNDFFKLIEWGDGRLDLFDLENDPAETANLAGNPDQAGRLAELTAKLHATLGPPGAGGSPTGEQSPEEQEEIRRRLAALGYV